MCGIFGFINNRNFNEPLLRKMGESITHRGPDDIGYHLDNGVGLGNVRLAIIDPEHGEQPVHSPDKQVVLVQNGEIFNFLELRTELLSKGYTFNTNCDTEVLLYMYIEYGKNFVSKLNGMFAIAIYDKRERKTILYRDRVGEKPLYYYKNENQILFSSEIKSIKECTKLQFSLTNINAMLRLNYVPQPHTAYEDVFHVEPGTFIEISEHEFSTTRWWSLADQKEQKFDENDWQHQCVELLTDATALRLVSDVPFGAFLSGGVDSSSVVGIMSSIMKQPVKTYTIGFNDKRFDESIYAQQAAEMFNTDHSCEIVDFDIVKDWSKFLHYCDQPHGDVSFIPMRKVSELASRDVKMVLTGDGADELFAGYEKYAEFYNSYSPNRSSTTSLKENYMPHLELFNSDECHGLWRNQFHGHIDFQLADNIVTSTLNEVEHFDVINRILYIDMMCLLPGNNLVKPDRMAMSHSLETRAPFLDYRLMEFAFKTPGDYKLRDGDKKHLLKKALTPIIGTDLAYRKKQMFTVPIGEWFKAQLSKYCHEMLLSESSLVLKFFNKEVVARYINEHLHSIENHTRKVRALISLELWLRDNL